MLSNTADIMTGQDIKDFRAKHSLTQDELSKLTGFNPKAIARWEAGKVTPMRANVMVLAQVFASYKKS